MTASMVYGDVGRYAIPHAYATTNERYNISHSIAIIRSIGPGCRRNALTRTPSLLLFSVLRYYACVLLTLHVILFISRALRFYSDARGSRITFGHIVEFLERAILVQKRL